MTKNPLILRNKAIRIRAQKEFMRLHEQNRTYIIGYQHLSALFLDHLVTIDIADMMRIVPHVPIYLIDRAGYVRAKVEQN